LPRSKLLGPVHPGEVLLEEFMKPRGLSRYRLAKELSVPVTRIQDILKGRRGISAETAARLEGFFGVRMEVWLGLQTRYELEVYLRDTKEAHVRKGHRA
jgi:antitoxin HigA-1